MLHWAAGCSERIDVMELLVRHGADVNARMKSGETPMMAAIDRGNTPEIIEWLLDNGTDIETMEHHGGTALIRAGWHNDPKVMFILIDHGANVRAKDEYGYTVLHTAMARHQLDTIEMLIALGADIHAGDDFGNTPLHKAASGSRGSEIADMLVGLGADPYLENKEGKTACRTLRIRFAYDC